MSKKVRVLLGVSGAAVAIVLCVVLVVFLLHGRNESTYIDTSGFEETVVVSTSEEERLGPGHEETEGERDVGEYNEDTLKETEKVGGIVYSCGILDFIDENKFSNVMLNTYNSVNVLQYNGGRYGIFDVQVETERGVFDGIWDDGAGVWYENAEDYEE